LPVLTIKAASSGAATGRRARRAVISGRDALFLLDRDAALIDRDLDAGTLPVILIVEIAEDGADDDEPTDHGIQ
jgi:hypothetical protein